ncbi:MAG: hypothetical protein FWF80_05900, partial [Defluviitaleaceae bacterium]|nr:hypothetical protein [Defluviitaleaceae bacterium]
TLRVLENLVVAVANVAGNVGALAGAASVVVSVVALLLAPIDIIQIALFIMAGVLALRQVDMRLGPLDMLANKHLYTREEAGGR